MNERSERTELPSKLYFRIGEVAGLVGVEPHVLRYWEREFRSIRPTKSAKGQRVYSRKDVENLLRVRDLLYRDGFTIAGAKKRLQRPEDAPDSASTRLSESPRAFLEEADTDGAFVDPVPSAPDTSPDPLERHAVASEPYARGGGDDGDRDEREPREAVATADDGSGRTANGGGGRHVRQKLEAMRAEVAGFLLELGEPASDREGDRGDNLRSGSSSRPVGIKDRVAPRGGSARD